MNAPAFMPIKIYFSLRMLPNVGPVEKIHDTYVNNDAICIRQ